LIEVPRCTCANQAVSVNKSVNINYFTDSEFLISFSQFIERTVRENESLNQPG